MAVKWPAAFTHATDHTDAAPHSKYSVLQGVPMKTKRISPLLAIAAMLAMAAHSLADVVVNDDLIVQGSQCIGLDCVNDEAFNGDTLRLKENNLRIRLHDTSAPDVLGQSWNLSANGSRNGSLSYFLVEQKSLTKDAIALSDGTAPLYDCSVAVPLGQLPPIVGVIPYGDPVTFPVNPVIDGTGTNWLYSCDTVVDFTVKPVLYLGAAADENNVSLGYDSRLETGTVSIGNATLLRNLKHVAAGLADTDILITQTLNEYAPYQDQEARVADLQQQLASLEANLSDIETRVYNNRAPTAPILRSPDNNSSGLPTTVILTWIDGTDADGDTLRHSVSVCVNQDFSSCTPIVVASKDYSLMLASLGSGTGLLLWLGLLMPSVRKQRTRWIYAVGLASMILFMSACGDSSDSNGGGTPSSYTVTSLSPATQYYWRISATDFIDTTHSPTRSFTTQ